MTPGGDIGSEEAFGVGSISSDPPPGPSRSTTIPGRPKASRAPIQAGFGDIREESGVDIPAREEAIVAIRSERSRQELLKEEGRFEFTCADSGMTPGQRLAALVEEVGEVAKAQMIEAGIVYDGDEKDGDVDKEVTQVAAICLAILEGRAKRRRLHGSPE